MRAQEFLNPAFQLPPAFLLWKPSQDSKSQPLSFLVFSYRPDIKQSAAGAKQFISHVLARVWFTFSQHDWPGRANRGTKKKER